MGRSFAGSKVVCGMMCKCKPEGVVKCATRAKVAIFMPGLDIAQMETKGTVLLRNDKAMLTGVDLVLLVGCSFDGSAT